MTKLYLISRSDLPAGLQAAQLAHSLRQFAADFPAEDKGWHETSNNLVLLEVADEAGLEHLADRLDELGCHVARFREPDLGEKLTAISALGERAHKALSSLPLALRAA